MTKRYVIGAALLLLLISTIYAQFGFSGSGATKDSQVIIQRNNESDKLINISVLIFEPAVTTSGNTIRDKMEEFYQACVAAGDPKPVECSYKKAAEFGATTTDYKMNMTSPPGAHFFVEYLNPMGTAATNQWTPVPGCEDVIANTPAIGYRPNAAGDLEAYTYYVGQCPLDPIANAQKSYFRVTYLPAPGEPIAPSSQTLELTNPQATFSNELTQVISNMVTGLSTTTLPGQSLPCLGFFLLAGLLISSLYFAGKSPVSLLDITTPRLPTPKGVAASGQVLAPFGYTEMKTTARAKMADATKALGITALMLKSRMAGDADLAHLESRISSQKGNRADQYAGDVAQGKQIASALVVAGRSVGMSAAELSGLANRLPYHYGDAEHKTVAELLKKLEEKGGRHTIMAMTLKDYLYGLRTFQSLEVLTGMPDIGKRSAVHQKVSSTLGKFYGANRYAILGPLVMASVDSAARTSRIMARMGKAIVTEAPTLARAVTKTTLGVVGGQHAMEALESKAKSSSTASWLFGQVNKRPGDILVGAMFPINDKMAHLYRSLNNEMLRDQMRYVLKQVYRKMGMNFNITAEELASMGHVDINILKRSNFHATAELLAVENEIKRILSNTSMTTNDKLHELMRLGQAHGATIDHNMVNVTTRLESIAASVEPEHMKMIQLQEVLEQQNKIRLSTTTGGRAHEDAYVCHVGGDSLNATHAWETMVLRTMVWDGENGFLRGGIKEELLSARLNVVNRLTSLDPTTAMEQLPEHMRNPSQLKAVAERNRSDLLALFTEEGKKMYAEFATNMKTATMVDEKYARREIPTDINKASIAQLVDFMFGGKMQRSTEIDKKTGKMVWYSGYDMELGIDQKATLVDVKRHWIPGLDSRHNFALGQWVESRFTKGYVPAFKAGIEAELDRMPGSTQWSVEERAKQAKKLWVADQLMKDMEQRFNSQFAQNTYGTTRETSRFYYGVLLGFMEKALQEKGYDNNHPDLQFLQKIDTTNPHHLDKLMQMMKIYHKEYDTVASRQMTYDDVARSDKAVVMLHEGGYAYYKKGMALSDNDRVLAGQTCLRDNNGQKKPFVPDDVAVQFGARDDLNAMNSSVRNSKNAADWEPFLAEVNKWAKEGGYNFDRQKVLEKLIWDARNSTYDYMLGQHFSEVTVESRRNVAPTAPSILRYLGVEAPDFTEKVWRPARDIVMHGLDYVSRIALLSGGPIHSTSYDITAVSSVYRQHSMRLASAIMAGKYEKDLSDDEKAVYRSVAMSNHAFFQVWQFAIDRNPWRASSSFGTHQAWSSFFHFGPAVPYDININLRSFMDKGTYANFMSSYGFPMQAAKFMMRPYVNMFRGFQMSMQGYASKWDSTDDTLRQWNYTNPRILEALQSMNPFSAAMYGKGKLSNSLSKLNVFGGSLERHQLAGADYQAGLLQSAPDIMLHRKGIYSTARTGDANPGESFYNYRSELQLDATMAEYLTRTRDATFAYDQAVRDSAMDNTTRRTVSAETLNIRRRQELDMFGFERNSLWGYFNPILFLHHIPVPIFPQSITPRDLIANWRAKAKHGSASGVGGFGEGINKMAQDIAHKSYMALHPHRIAQVVYCPKCGMSNFRGSMCKNPSCKSYLY
ncbi:Uncharacterised protein [Candidatus Bilamarchaeum dharawalense]|uniref:Uncharacterized protein n=1 Tax=Candidatus Bilamarchaeum dharawalense TaxID=2885759 RepID=A0A5E4LLY8_9ARCH|nr:Uncharacterised protein [Candidatus Bilamarchaeum dharawalense]